MHTIPIGHGLKMLFAHPRNYERTIIFAMLGWKNILEISLPGLTQINMLHLKSSGHFQICPKSDAHDSSKIRSSSPNAFLQSLSTSIVPTTGPPATAMGMMISDCVFPKAVR